MIDFIRDFFTTYNDIFSVITLSLIVSLSSTLISSCLGLILGIYVSLNDFKMKKTIMRVTNTLMSLPPVLIGLLVYMLLSRKGPLGSLQLLFTPLAMIISQTLLVLPIIFGLTVSSISDICKEVEFTCISLGANKKDTFITILYECKLQLLSVITAGFGRAISEVGAVMMVGGNIKGSTRVMTTYIALETGKGNFNEAVFIGIVLLFISFFVNTVLYKLKGSE
ncbi:MAG: putative tungstate transporter, permease protein TupB [Bacillota bacterium]|jgi:tungstate transport system permease protein|nr:putative tungstate transporter, permease protein TupB [Bacillota bacterium]